MRTIQFVIPLLCILIPSAAPSAPDNKSAALMPSTAVLETHLAIKKGDAGQKWVFDQLIRYLVSHADETGTPPPVADIEICNFSDYAFALLPLKAGHEEMIMAASLLPSNGQFGVSYGSQKFQLTVRNQGTATRTQVQLLSFLLGLACKVPSGPAPDDGILFNASREGRGKFSAYHVSDTRAVMATKRDYVKAALSGTGGLTTTEAYRETMALLPDGSDAYGYAHNEGHALAELLGKKDSGWQKLLIALLTPARRIGLALDVVDRERSEIVIALIPVNPGAVHDLRMLLEPGLPLLATQCLDPQIVPEIRYEELPNALKISAKLTNTGGFWKRTFKPAGPSGRAGGKSPGPASPRATPRIRTGE
ncbi:MAG: hypothetical protein NT045_07275 [Candidatus Aureabacteria bacterium]|nr:hypothetical protein [Candidatus Auribacterota bacterium]